MKDVYPVGSAVLVVACPSRVRPSAIVVDFSLRFMTSLLKVIWSTASVDDFRLGLYETGRSQAICWTTKDPQ